MGIKKGISTIVAVLFLAIPYGALSTSKLERIVEGIERTYSNLKGLEASFTQKNLLANRPGAIVARGTVFFKKPGFMRWDYRTPKGQRIVSDGRTIWIYQPLLKQVMVLPVREGGEILQDLLSGRVRLKEDFHISLKGENPESYDIQLRPKGEREGMKTLTLKVRKKDFMILETILEDPFGNITRVRFGRIKKDPSLKPDFFTFEIPEGVKVIR